MPRQCSDHGAESARWPRGEGVPTRGFYQRRCLFLALHGTRAAALCIIAKVSCPRFYSS